MKNLFAALLGAVAVAMVSGAATGRAGSLTTDDRALYTADELAAIYRHSPLGRLPPDPTDRVADDPRAAVLGQFLFFDARFSANGKVSCATCHDPARAFTDGRPLAQGISVGTRNAPTALNAAFGQWFFLDGRTDSLWSQALQPFENPSEFGGDRLHIVRVVAHDPALRIAYRQVFGSLPLPGRDRPVAASHARPDSDPRLPVAQAWEGMAPEDRRAVDEVFSNLGKAIEAYERKLVSGGCAFDQYVAGLKAGDPLQQRTLSPAAKRGLKLFVGAGHCDLCHSGPAFTDGQFHNLGLPILPGEAPDPGRAGGIRRVRADPFNGAGPFGDAPADSDVSARLAFLPQPESQVGAFKTPTLRDVARTAPYMHDGRFANLEQVMDFYGRSAPASTGRLVGVREQTIELIPHLSGTQQADLVAFLETLTGPPLPRDLTHAPSKFILMSPN